ncbi:hypothetical protein EYF80_061479 [Liparis tanakae]|uniref:Uncharacterized protein n=1 Tax=Liparis tanakae TaxID=230148 RepID=A0A4Z2EJ56_9TELE|nr:hypothetical protein EYF80_061479 [Liparis tanakae]
MLRMPGLNRRRGKRRTSTRNDGGHSIKLPLHRAIGPMTTRKAKESIDQDGVWGSLMGND